MIRSSQSVITINIGGQNHEFGILLPRDMFDTIDWANSRERTLAMATIPADNVADRIKIFQECGNRFSVHNIAALTEDVGAIQHMLYLCYRRHNQGVTEEEFRGIFDMMDLPLLQVYLDAVSGMDEPETPEDTTNPPEQMAAQPGPQS